MPALVKCQEMNSYVSEDGELITIPASLPKPDVSAMTASNGICLKVKTIVYYENYFRDGWVGQGNDPIARYVFVSKMPRIPLLNFNLMPGNVHTLLNIDMIHSTEQ